MLTGATITLPNGLWVNGDHHRLAGLRPLMGEDESFLADVRERWQPAECVTAILGRCLTRLGSLDLAGQDPLELVRLLTVGDREALLLHLRCLTLGDALTGGLGCPHPDCGAPTDLALHVSDLLLPPYSQPQPDYQAVVQNNGSTWQVRFRLPTGQDQEDAARLGGRQVEEGASLLMKRCVLEVSAGDNGDELLAPDEDIPEEIVAALPDMLAERDPQAEIQLDLTCPTCGHEFSALFDTAGYFLREVASRSMYLYRQVHLLALYYHWSESEIMGMTAEKRQCYLDLLEEAFGEASRHD